MTAATVNAPKFTARQTRALHALRLGPTMRESLDRIAGCSNSPALVAELVRKLGSGSITCTRIQARDRDGKDCHPGCYSLSELGYQKLAAWGW